MHCGIVSIVCFLSLITVDCVHHNYDNMPECQYKICKNGGTCVIAQYGIEKCICPTGYMGFYCQRTGCAKSPCLHRGTCRPHGTGGYFCYCRPGYLGKNCEKEVRSKDY